MPFAVSSPPSTTPGTTAGSAPGPYVLHSDPQSSHQQIARLLRRINRQPILDVGAAQGLLGQVLQHDRLTIDAIEAHPGWAEQAKPYYRTVYPCAVEQAPLPPHCYPVVVCADVLEHTMDPAAVLRQLRQTATPDALFVISLPNVAHIAARLLLLFGQFPKMERGIFDRTHRHFYTRRTAIDLLQSVGLQVVEVRATPVPLRQIWHTRADSRLVAGLMRIQQGGLTLAPTLFGYQFILVARPRPATPPANTE